MSAAAIDSAAKWVGKLLVQEVQFLIDVSDKVEQLKDELEWMQCFLLDADKQQNKNSVVRKWVSGVRDLAQEAEDVIEMYILDVSHKRVPPPARTLVPWTDLKWLLCVCGDVKPLHIVGSQIDHLTKKIKQLNSRLQTYGIKSSSDDKDLQLSEQRRTYSHTEDLVVGLNQDVENVADKLLASTGQHKVVVIHGMGGIGKTTLAREVYHHGPLKDQFEGFAWAYVSQQLHLGSVCRDILLQLIPRTDKEERKLVQQLPDSQLPTMLYNLVQTTSCLVVLDDIWFDEDWSCLKHGFPLNNSSSGSKLLVTTRNPQIFSRYSMVYYYEARFLDHGRSWEIFQVKANFNKDEAEPEMVELGEKMLKHCNGHPLAIVVLGGVLSTKNRVEEWQNVYDNLHSNLEGDGLYSGVYEVLALSYYELPYHLKACFLNFGYFPHDLEIPAERMYHLWTAEGIVSSTEEQLARGKRSLEDTAKVYLNELVQKGMVQVMSRDLAGDIQTCKLHDLMLDKCLELAKKENFLQRVDHSAHIIEASQQGGPPSYALYQKLRRLSIVAGDDHGVQNLLPDSSKVPYLRSLLLFPSDKMPDESCEWIKGVSENFQLLRVLDCTGLSKVSGKLHSSVGSLIYLRYLSLKGTMITEVPPEIGNLRSLLILDLRPGNANIKLPNVFWKIQSLRQLYLPNPLCYEIEKITLGNLRKLEIIEGLDVDRVDVEGLQELTGMQKLSLCCTDNEQGLCHFLKCSSLKDMSLRISSSMFEKEMVSDMLSGCRFLTNLCIRDGYRRIFRSAEQRLARMRLETIFIRHIRRIPQNVQGLSFESCVIFQSCITALERLPLLKELWLTNCYKESELHITRGGFPELTYLSMSNLESLTEWTVEKGGLPKLKELHIYDCPIKMLPDTLPAEVSITCFPQVPGIERYGSRPQLSRQVSNLR